MFFQLQGAVRSEISSIWAYAYLYGKFKGSFTSAGKPSAALNLDQRVPAEEQLQAMQKAKGEVNGIMYDTALSNRFGKWRTLYGFGSRNPDVVFESIAYFDLLLQDLGLNSWRKGWWWMGEIFGGSYDQADYRDLVEEWRRSQKKEKV